MVFVFNFRPYKTFNRITQHYMEISDIVYLAFSTIMVVVILHVGVFWVSRLIQPPKPKIVYVDRAPIQPIVPEVRVGPYPADSATSCSPAAFFSVSAAGLYGSRDASGYERPNL